MKRYWKGLRGGKEEAGDKRYRMSSEWWKEEGKEEVLRVVMREAEKGIEEVLEGVKMEIEQVQKRIR